MSKNKSGKPRRVDSRQAATQYLTARIRSYQARVDEYSHSPKEKDKEGSAALKQAILEVQTLIDRVQNPAIHPHPDEISKAITAAYETLAKLEEAETVTPGTRGTKPIYYSVLAAGTFETWTESQQVKLVSDNPASPLYEDEHGQRAGGVHYKSNLDLASDVVIANSIWREKAGVKSYTWPEGKAPSELARATYRHLREQGITREQALALALELAASMEATSTICDDKPAGGNTVKARKRKKQVTKLGKDRA